MTLEPVALEDANAFVAKYHRHCGPVVGHKFSLAATVDGAIVGVAIVGRPVARHRDNGATLEVTRLCTDGTRNACSFLYAASARAAKALGYTRLGTYTLERESGVSLRAAGWRLINDKAGGWEWNNATRSRAPARNPGRKLLWES